MEQLFSLQGKTALITGGTAGLGKAIAMGLGKAGARVVINGRTSRLKVEKALDEFHQESIEAFGYLCDVTDEIAVENLIETIEKDIGPLDILVNNAGINLRESLVEISLEKFNKNIRINLIAPFIVAKAVARRMIKRQHGKIINMCSLMSELGRNTIASYAASKGGLKMLTQNMATEWAKYNIQVNGIGPGYFATDLTEPLRQEGTPFNDFIISRTPAGRWGKPEELVGAAIFLSSRASDFVNGHILYVDGGILATIGKPANE